MGDRGYSPSEYPRFLERILDVKNKQKISSVQTGDSRFAFLCILPAFAGVGLVVLAPILKAVWMSFTDYKLTSVAPPRWNNFANYKSLFLSGKAGAYFAVTLTFIAMVVAIQFLFALAVALLLNARFIRGRNVMRALFMIPWTIPSVVTALLWSWMLHSQYGVVNWLLFHMGLIDNINLVWTSSRTLALPSVIMACVWRQTPYMMVMLLAGLQSVPNDLVEAARVDGANGWHVFAHVMLPSIRPVIDTSIMVAVINNSQMFTIIYNMTGGGPTGRTTTFSVGAYLEAFISYDFGKGSALGVVWLVFLGGFVFLYKRYSDKKASSYL